MVLRTSKGVAQEERPSEAGPFDLAMGPHSLTSTVFSLTVPAQVQGQGTETVHPGGKSGK